MPREKNEFHRQSLLLYHFIGIVLYSYEAHAVGKLTVWMKLSPLTSLTEYLIRAGP